jgi:hypothetical protein
MALPGGRTLGFSVLFWGYKYMCWDFFASLDDCRRRIDVTVARDELNILLVALWGFGEDRGDGGLNERSV